MDELVREASAIVREAGELARRSFGNVGVVGDHGHGNVFTETDQQVDRLIREHLGRVFPDHGVYSEESGHTGGETSHRWILDPIDGTRHFLAGVPLYSISLALEVEGSLVAGIVYNPETEQLFTAVAGLGAQLNGESIRCSSVETLRHATVCVEVPRRRSPADVREIATEAIGTLMGVVERVRVIGASALGLCYCANGSFDLYLNLSACSKEWDLAAGKVVLSESGATLVEPGEFVIGGPQQLVDDLFSIVPAIKVS